MSEQGGESECVTTDVEGNREAGSLLFLRLCYVRATRSIRPSMVLDSGGGTCVEAWIAGIVW